MVQLFSHLSSGRDFMLNFNQLLIHNFGHKWRENGMEHFQEHSYWFNLLTQQVKLPNKAVMLPDARIIEFNYIFISASLSSGGNSVNYFISWLKHFLAILRYFQEHSRHQWWENGKWHIQEHSYWFSSLQLQVKSPYKTTMSQDIKRIGINYFLRRIKNLFWWKFYDRIYFIFLARYVPFSEMFMMI